MKFQKFRVTKDYQSPYPDSIIFKKGEEVLIGSKSNDDPDWQDWVWCQGNHGNKAWVPLQYLEIRGESGIFNTFYDAKELSIQTGETLTVFQVLNGFVEAENNKGFRGWAPLKCLSIIE